MMAGLREWKGDGKKWMELKYNLDAESIGLEKIKDLFCNLHQQPQSDFLNTAEAVCLPQCNNPQGLLAIYQTNSKHCSQRYKAIPGLFLHEKQRHYIAYKVHLVKAMVFPVEWSCMDVRVGL